MTSGLRLTPGYPIRDAPQIGGSGYGESMTDATTLVILGAGGDLTSRLLLPALGQLLVREPDRAVRIIGADREEWTDAELATVVRTAFASMDAEDAAARVDVTYVRTDITQTDDLRALTAGLTGRVALYFAVPPSVAAACISTLTPDMLPAGTMLVMEKPFGTDEASARELNRTLTALVPESQVFRVDHFLGRSTTLNLLGARFANRILEPLWSAESIESVDIIYDESLALEGRAGYYDRAGALVDMIQSHLLQVLAVLAMDEPASLDEVDFRAATGAVLRATAVWGDDPAASSRRARYTAGEIDGTAKPSYVDEPGSILTAIPRHSPRRSSRCATPAGPECRSGSARARPSARPPGRSSCTSDLCGMCRRD